MVFSSQLFGDLKSMSVPDIFQWVSQNRKSGYLFFQKEAEEVKVFFQNGLIINTTSNIPDFLLGKFLIRYKKIDKKTLAKILKLQIKEKLPLGQLLIGKKLITKEELHQIIKQQIIEITVSLLSWEKGFFHFEEKNFNKNTDFAISVDEILFECLRRKDELELFKKVLTEYDVVKVISDDIPQKFKKVIDGKRNVKEIINEIGGDYFEAYKELYQLLLDKKIEKTGEKSKIEDPTVEFLVSLELFGKGKIYESYAIAKKLFEKFNKNQAISNFYHNLTIYINTLFEKKLGGENACFKVNNYKINDQKIYLTPKEGFILSRLEEYPCFDELFKVVNIEKLEIKLILLKLYKYNLIMLKEIKQKETKELEEDTLLSLLYIMKNGLTGALEVINEKFSAFFYFENGEFVIGYSTTENYDFPTYISKVKDIPAIKENDFKKFITYLINKEIIPFKDLKKVLEVYNNMLLQESVKNKAISNIFVFNEKIGLDISIDIKILYIVIFIIVNYKRDINIDFDVRQSYELTLTEQELLDYTEDSKILSELIKKFENGILKKETLANLSKEEINILKILYYLDFIKPIQVDEISVEELKDYLKKLNSMTPKEIFNIETDTADIEYIKKTYIKLTKRYHPDLYDDKEKKTLAQEIFRVIKEAFDKITNEEKESDNEMKIDAKKIFLAEQLVTSGKVYLNIGRISDAVDAFFKAYENFDKDEEVKCYYAVALIKTGKFKEGFEILNEIDFTKYNDPNIYFAYLDAAIKLGKKAQGKKILAKLRENFKSQYKKAEYYEKLLS